MYLVIFILFMGIFNPYSNGYSHHLKFSLDNIPSGLKSVSCSDGISSCPHSGTCCQLESGEYGCCPLADAVCCTDHLHCCPYGYTCDVEHSRCQQGFERVDSVVCSGSKTSGADGETCCQLQSGDYDYCPLPDAVCCNKDEKSVCLEDTTCYELTNSSYGCCAYRQASCCSDQIHCCGEGYSCDESGSRCIRHIGLTPLSIFGKQTCPDGITKCSLSSTCCPNKNNDQITYSCCPYTWGVCCGSNGSSCCPHKYICDEDHLTCQLNEPIALENDIFNQRGTLRTVQAPSPAREIILPNGTITLGCNSSQTLCSGNFCCSTVRCTCLPTMCGC